jgi:transcriptional regulator
LARTSLPILPGNVELLALGALASGGTMHGFEILRWIERQSDGDLLVEEGALYPALHRMEKRGWLEASWAVSEKGRRAKYYDITASGRRAVVRERGAWTRYVSAVGKVLTKEGTT